MKSVMRKPWSTLNRVYDDDQLLIKGKTMEPDNEFSELQ